MEFLGFYCKIFQQTVKNWQYLVETSTSLYCYKQQQHVSSAGLVCVQSVCLSLLRQKVTGIPLIVPHNVELLFTMSHEKLPLRFRL